MTKSNKPGMLGRLMASIMAIFKTENGVLPVLKAQSFRSGTISRRRNMRNGKCKCRIKPAGSKLRKLIKKERLALTNPGGTISAYFRYQKANRMCATMATGVV